MLDMICFLFFHDINKDNSWMEQCLLPVYCLHTLHTLHYINVHLFDPIFAHKNILYAHSYINLYRYFLAFHIVYIVYVCISFYNIYSYFSIYCIFLIFILSQFPFSIFYTYYLSLLSCTNINLILI